jgi:hypothetical protein
MQISREGAGNGTRGGRAPHFSVSAFQCFSFLSVGFLAFFPFPLSSCGTAGFRRIL